MKNIAFFGSLLITVGLIFALNSKIGDLPAFGKLLNPATGFYQNAETDAFYLPENIKNALLKEKVEVFFDDKRIPHIFAENEHDLYFTQGYIVASLRLWQMEFQVLAADGRLSEILGEKTLEFDKNQRRLGLGFGAQNKLKALETDSLALDILNAYTAGINAFIEQIPEKKLPLEYKLIGYKPEKWTNYKTMLVLMNMSNILASAGDDVENANFVAKYGKALFDQIYPTNINMEPVIPTPENGWLGKNTNTDTLKIIEKNNPKDIKISKVKDKLNYHIGSNNWAVSGTKTKSKYPLLSNDPHLSLSLPSVWIEMHLVGPNSNAYGVTFPGSPGIVIGFNEKIGWGMTNSGRDVKDYYTVEYKDASKNEYKYQNEWKKTTKKIEEYFVLGKKTVYDTVNYTVLGPVLHPDFETQNGKKDIAIQWMAHRESKEYLMFYYLNRAENFEDYLNATKYFDCPAQNMVFACVDGDIALRNQGKFPINAFEESKFLQTTNQAKVWQNFIPFDDNPMQHNPSRGFVSSANQESTDASYPYYYTGGFENYRNRVINQKLSAMQNATAQDMIALQKNNYNLKAAESLPLMLAYLNKVEGFNFEQQDILKTLSNWDFYNNADSKGAIYYELFFEKYYALLWDELTEGFVVPSYEQTIVLLADSVMHPFIDLKATKAVENTQDLMVQAFEFTCTEAAKYENQTWGDFNDLTFQHVARIGAFSRKIVYGGNNHVVNAARKNWGPSWRMILDFTGGKINGLGVYPGGQSGNPGSKYYDNMLNEWAKDEFHVLNNAASKSTFNNKNYQKITFSN